MDEIAEPYHFSFLNTKTGKKLHAEFRSPQLVRRVNPHLKREIPIWVVRYTVSHNGETENRESVGATWLQATLLAVEYLHRLIPRAEEEDWETEDGISSWIALPSLLPISWDHKVFCDAREAVEEIDRAASQAASRKRPDR